MLIANIKGQANVLQIYPEPILRTMIRYNLYFLLENAPTKFEGNIWQVQYCNGKCEHKPILKHIPLKYGSDEEILEGYSLAVQKNKFKKRVKVWYPLYSDAYDFSLDSLNILKMRGAK